MKRIFSALLLAVGVVTLLWFGFMAAVGAPTVLPNDSNGFLSFAKWYLAALAGVLMLGLPCHWLLKHFEFRRWWAYALSAATVVGLPMWLLAGTPSPVSAWHFFLALWLPSVTIGTFGGLVFWSVGVRAGSELRIKP
jgi:hypothetical protein